MGEQLQIDGTIPPAGFTPVEFARGNSRLSIFVITAGLACCLAAGIGWLRPEPQVLLCRSVLPLDVERICEALSDIGVSYSLRDDGSAVFVPKNKRHAARLQVVTRILNAGGFVRLELVDFTQSAISTGATGYVAALQAELEATLGSMEGVESARVLIETPGNLGRINGDRPLALVLLHTARSTKLTPGQVHLIQQLVASSTDLLTPAEVTISENAASLASIKHEAL